MKTVYVDHPVIFLQPECSAGYEGRTWCQDDVDACDCGKLHKNAMYALITPQRIKALELATGYLDTTIGSVNVSDADRQAKVLRKMLAEIKR